MDGGCLLRAYQFLPVVAVAAFLLMICPIRTAAQRDPQRPATAIEVRLIPKKKSIRVGEHLEVRVEIWNVSRQTFFIEKAIYELCGPSSPLSLRLELGPPMKPQPGRGCASDCLWRAEDGFARRLVMGWTSLPAAISMERLSLCIPTNFRSSTHQVGGGYVAATNHWATCQPRFFVWMRLQSPTTRN